MLKEGCTPSPCSPRPIYLPFHAPVLHLYNRRDTTASIHLNQTSGSSTPCSYCISRIQSRKPPTGQRNLEGSITSSHCSSHPYRPASIAPAMLSSAASRGLREQQEFAEHSREGSRLKRVLEWSCRRGAASSSGACSTGQQIPAGCSQHCSNRQWKCYKQTVLTAQRGQNKLYTRVHPRIHLYTH